MAKVNLINSPVLKKSEPQNVLIQKAEIFRGQLRYVRNFFFFIYIYTYNAVICSLIVFGFVCWGGNILKFVRGRLERLLIKKKRKKERKEKLVMLGENHWTVLRRSMKIDSTKN